MRSGVQWKCRGRPVRRTGYLCGCARLGRSAPSVVVGCTSQGGTGPLGNRYGHGGCLRATTQHKVSPRRASDRQY